MWYTDGEILCVRFAAKNHGEWSQGTWAAHVATGPPLIADTLRA